MHLTLVYGGIWAESPCRQGEKARKADYDYFDPIFTEGFYSTAVRLGSMVFEFIARLIILGPKSNDLHYPFLLVNLIDQALLDIQTP